MIQKHVFLVRGSRERIERSLISLKALEEFGGIAPFEDLASLEELKVLLGSHAKMLEQIYPDRKVKFWGFKFKQRSRWEEIKEGDYLVFFIEDRYVCSARAYFKTENREIALRTWGKDERGETWELLVFLSDISVLNMPKNEFNQKAGYSRKFVPRALIKVAPKVAERIISEIIEKSARVEIFPVEESLEILFLDPRNLEEAISEMGLIFERETLEEVIAAFDSGRHLLLVELLVVERFL